MMTITINYWLLLVGAVSGATAAFAARGRNRMIKAAVIGAVVAFVLGFVREWV